MIVTTTRNGRANAMTQSWYTTIDFEPPIVGCVVSNRNYTFGTLKATKECVINIPTVEAGRAGRGMLRGRFITWAAGRSWSGRTIKLPSRMK